MHVGRRVLGYRTQLLCSKSWSGVTLVQGGVRVCRSTALTGVGDSNMEL